MSLSQEGECHCETGSVTVSQEGSVTEPGGECHCEPGECHCEPGGECH